ncbi:hypothetical protein Tco_1064965, partial [Tanacetum coccineum]
MQCKFQIKAFLQTFPSLAIFRTIFCIEDYSIKLATVGGTDYDSHEDHEAYGEWRAYGIKLSGFGTINENRLQAYCKARKDILRPIPITDKFIGLNPHKHRHMHMLKMKFGDNNPVEGNPAPSPTIASSTSGQ